jgi:nicotinamidase-related amidase
MPEKKTLVWMDVDTQEDFMLPHGAFGKLSAGAGFSRIIPNLKRVCDYAAEQNLTTILATDAHVPDDPEFSTYGFPAHCVLGPTLVIENREGAFTAPLPEADRLVVMVHKQHFAVGTNPNFPALIEDLGRALGTYEVVATGVATQGCVKQSIHSLLNLGVSVNIVVDAVGPDIQEEAGRIAIEELVALGVRAVTTDQLCSGSLEA